MAAASTSSNGKRETEKWYIVLWRVVYGVAGDRAGAAWCCHAVFKCNITPEMRNATDCNQKREKPARSVLLKCACNATCALINQIKS